MKQVLFFSAMGIGAFSCANIVPVTTKIQIENLAISAGKNSIERVTPDVPPLKNYLIFINTDMLQTLIDRYTDTTATIPDVLITYYNTIVYRFDWNIFDNWKLIDFQRMALVIYNSMGEIQDFITLHTPKNGVKLLIDKKGQAGADQILDSITEQ